MTRRDQARLARLACEREAAEVHRKLRRGLTGLATVVATSALVGIFGTVLGIVNSFRGVGAEASTVLGWTAQWLSEAQWPTAFGLAVGLLAFAVHRHCTESVETFKQEMGWAIIELENTLLRLNPALKTTAAAPARARQRS